MIRISWNPDLASEEITRKAMGRLEKAAEVVADRARSLVPVGKDIPQGEGKWSKREAGALKRTIRVVRLKGDPKLDVRVYAGNRTRGVFYAHFLEFGTIKMRAKPFLRPALNSTRGLIKGMVETGG